MGQPIRSSMYVFGSRNICIRDDCQHIYYYSEMQKEPQAHTFRHRVHEIQRLSDCRHVDCSARVEERKL